MNDDFDKNDDGDFNENLIHFQKFPQGVHFSMKTIQMTCLCINDIFYGKWDSKKFPVMKTMY